MLPLYTQFKEQQKNINMKNYSITTSGWYRIAEFDLDNGATALISFAVKESGRNNAGILSFAASKRASSANLEKVAYQQYESAKHFTKFRLVLKNYSLSYIEIYKASTAIVTLSLKLSADINTKLYDSAEEGNIPDGYSIIELEL